MGVIVVRANLIIPLLCKVIDFPQEVAQRVDRSLFEGGFRAKGVGSNVPDMTRSEALTFFVACMVSSKTTKAAEEVRPWLLATSKLNMKRTIAPRSRNALDTNFPTAHHYTSVISCFGQSPRYDGRVRLINHLESICCLLQDEDFSPEKVTVVFNISDLKVRVFYNDLTVFDDTFTVNDAVTDKPIKFKTRSSGRKILCSISGEIFKAINLYT
jgi:hypothetical protein